MDVMNHEDGINHEGDNNHEGPQYLQVGKNHEGGGGKQASWEQLAEMAQTAATSFVQFQNKQPRIQRKKFTAVQVQELESTFQRTKYLDVPTK